jgi:primase-polymerase (primpol)-like protein
MATLRSDRKRMNLDRHFLDSYVAATRLGLAVPVYRELMALHEFNQAPADRTDSLAIRTGWVGHLRNNIPTELQHRTTWMVGRVTGNPARRPQKLPLSGRDERDRRGRRPCGSVSEPADWLSFPAANRILASEQNLELLGLVLTTADPYVAIDIDACVDPRTNAALPWVKQFARRLDGYTELSYSGTGLRILVRVRRELMMAIGTGKFHKALDLEVYGHSRWVVMTGRRCGMGYRGKDIPERTDELLELLHEHLDPGDWEKLSAAIDADSDHQRVKPGYPASRPQEARQRARSGGVEDCSDNDLIKRLETAYGSPRGTQIRELMEGCWEGRYPSQSEADLALCGYLFGVFGQSEAVRHVFLQSALGQRLTNPAPGAKRKPRTYLDRTLARAEQNWRLKHKGRVYTPTVTPANYDEINARRR